MANRNALLGRTKVKVEQMSGFDKGSYYATTAPLGAIIPLRKQLLLPGNGTCRIKISAQLPPLASDAFLRTHLKVEAFQVPCRVLTKSFESWFADIPLGVWNGSSMSSNVRGALPRLDILSTATSSDPLSQLTLDEIYGPHSLLDYLGVKKRMSLNQIDQTYIVKFDSGVAHQYYNLLPVLAYQMICDQWYRNKLVENPYFVAPSTSSTSMGPAAFIPYVASETIKDVQYKLNTSAQGSAGSRGVQASAKLNNGHILELRYRNYGDDYLTTALPTAQSTNISVDTSAGSFTIGALRQATNMAHFTDINQLAGPDFVQANAGRYGVSPGSQVVQRPVLLGSADFPMFTSGVEQTGTAPGSTNPFTSVGTRYGRAHAEGTDFVCEFHVNEPSYFFVMASLVPEANYAAGVARDMRIFTQPGSLVDLPVASLEGVGFEPIYRDEVDAVEGTANSVFAYQNRYMWHKAGQLSEVHGLFRQGASLQMFIPQRAFSPGVNLNSNFLKVRPTDLDNVTAVSGAVSQYGVMIDSYIDLRVSEPLSESRLPSLVDPAEEHGKDVYLRRGGTGV